eukprot:TRINITY_DN1472_c0_g1_i2.p1 TRINITY_DN1472_c0_g1~~TRINITY_DN1472_c0_g1_i2.p1  ORF type:complete len:283 (+),score=71.26 TRINITY_DN1472_c0_g1_i2:97-945(+)
MSADFVPPLYKDLGKKSRDLLSKNFPDSVNLELNQNEPLSVKLTTTSRAGGSSFEVEASKEFRVPSLELPSKVTVFTESLDKYYVDGQVENLLLPGSKLNLRSTYKAGQYENKLSSEYKRNYLSFSSAFSAASKNTATASVAVGGKCGFLAGGEGELAVESKQVTSSSLGVAYVSKNFEVFGVSKYGAKGRVHSVSYWAALPSGVNFASELLYDASTKPSARFVLEKSLAENLNGKVRWDSKNRLAVSLVTKLNPNLELTVAEEVDFEAANVAKVGLSLTFK